MENLWPDFVGEILEKNDSIEILRHQARAINKSTGDKVKATFSKMEYKKSPMGAVAQLGMAMQAASGWKYEEILDDELQDKENINKLFKSVKYKFEIYNDEYRFRMFVLNYSELFPVFLEVDEGILDDINYDNGSEINSNDELKSVIRDIFASKKVKTVISRMMEIE